MADENSGDNTNENVLSRMKTLLDYLKDGLYEKDDAVRLSLLAAVSGESVFFLGPPGVAKSMISSRIAKVFRDIKEGEYFEYLMNEYSTPEDIFGPVSLEQLKHDVYTRQTEGYLPNARVAFLDEIWKSGPAILNTLLTILNEKKFKNGKETVKVPLMLLLAASNELPEKGRGLEALYDRFILRVLVNPVQDENLFHSLITAPCSAETAAMTEEQKAAAVTFEECAEWAKAIDKVEVGDDVLGVITAIRKELTARNEAKKENSIKGQDVAENDEEYDTPKLQKDDTESEENDEEYEEYRDDEDDGDDYQRQTLSVMTAIRDELSTRKEEKSRHITKDVHDEDTNPDEYYYVSDRRWKKIVHILRTSAFLNGRGEVDLMDASLIEHCIWSNEAEQKEVQEAVEKVLLENGIDCGTSIAGIEQDIEGFKAEVNKKWFGKKKDKIVTMGDESCYECLDSNNNTWYVGVSEHKKRDSYYYQYYVVHNVYDASGQGNTTRTFSRTGDTITCDQPFTVKKIREATQYSDNAHSTLQQKFDAQHYKPIVSEIDEEIAAIKKREAEDAVPFKANIFADPRYADVLLQKMEDAIKALEDKKVALDKEHKRYYKAGLKVEWHIGDVILNDGSVYTQQEAGSLSDKERADAIAAVFVMDGKAYVLGVDEKTLAWEKTASYADGYGAQLCDKYKTGWKVPNKEMLKAIYGSMETLNKTLKAIGKAALQGGKYWSSSQKDNASAYYADFGKECAEDDTTKSHEYLVRVVHNAEAI